MKGKPVMLKYGLLVMLVAVPVVMVRTIPTTVHAQNTFTGTGGTSNELRLVSGSVDGHFTGAIVFPEKIEGDEAIVRVFYWRHVEGIEQEELLLSKTSVIPVYAGAAVMFDDVPAEAGKIKSVDVTIVKLLRRESLRVEDSRPYNRLR